MANFSIISSLPSDLPCTSSEHIYFSGKVSRSYRQKTGIWAENPDSSAARHEQFSAVEYVYKPPSVEESDDSVLPIDDSAEYCGTVIHTPRHNKRIEIPVPNPSVLGFDPLSSFMVHQTDKPLNHERRHVEEQTRLTTIRQIQSSLSLHNDHEVLPIDDSADFCGTVLHTPHPLHNKGIPAPVANQSILGFDPLSSFTVHQTDKPLKYERSYVEERTYPTALRQVHGSLSLHNEKLVKAITDATAGQINWESLKDLDLSGKGLTSLHGLDQYCPSLAMLNIDNNNIEHLVGCPTKLRILNANSNRISSMTSWAHLPHLCRINAAGNDLRHLDGLAELVHLTELDVSKNRINNIDGLAHLTELRKLNVHDNFLERVQWGDWLWTRLVELDMSFNDLYTIDSLDALPRLETLNLAQNCINSFSVDSREPHMRLRTVNLKKNSIMTFDLWYFPVLQDLNLDENLIMSADSLRELPTARSLIKLSLRAQKESVQGHQNKLVNTMMDTPAYFQELYLSENPTTCSEGRLAMPPNLKHRNIRVLEMASCGITELPLHFGQYFPACHTMNLNYNSIVDIVELRGLVSVEKLLLARNCLTKPKIISKVMRTMPDLHTLDIRENTFNSGWYNTMTGSRAATPREYPPGTATPGDLELPGRVDDLKSRWYRRLPEVVKNSRLLINLLLAINCPLLRELDGAEWNGKIYIDNKDRICHEMADLRIALKKSTGQNSTQ